MKMRRDESDIYSHIERIHKPNSKSGEYNPLNMYRDKDNPLDVKKRNF